MCTGVVFSRTTSHGGTGNITNACVIKIHVKPALSPCRRLLKHRIEKLTVLGKNFLSFYLSLLLDSFATMVNIILFAV